MQRFPESRFTPGMAVRMFADVVIVQIALIAALGVRLFFLFAFDPDAHSITVAEKAHEYLTGYTSSAFMLTSICLVVFYLNGFYTYGRYYQGRYKALVVTQAVSLSFLLYGFLSYFFASAIHIPRGALFLSWMFATGMLVGARVWSQIWDQFVRPEREAAVRRGDSGRHILVVGGAGYIGSSLIPKLLDRGYRVRVLDALLFGEGPIASFIDHKNLEVVQGDFRHVEYVVEAMRDVDSVVHLGAIVGDPACNLDESLTIDVNLSATRMIAELAKSAQVERFVFASTCSVYGAVDGVLDEHSQVKPVSLYGRTKLASEQILVGMSDERFSPTIVRFATIYGLSGRTRFDLVVNLLSAKARIDGEITVHGGNQWRPFVHVDDAALAVAKILDAPRSLVANQIFNVGSNEQNHTIAEIGEMVQQHVVSAKLTVSEENKDVRNYRVDFSKLRNLLDYEPNWIVDDGIQQVLEAIANGEVTDYRDAKYSNVAFLTQEGTTGLARDQWARDLIRLLASDTETG